ncbi:50S ribosomal protein L10 [Patescibacteria group bacterium]
MITKQKKKEIIKELADKFSKQKAIVFSDYSGLTVNQAQELRRKLREQNIDYRVAKKSLIDLALKQSGLGDNVKIKDLNGQISVALGYDDEVLPARILYNFAKSNENLKMLAGLVQGEYIDSNGMVKLATIPSKQELLAKVVGSISSPMSGLLNAFQGNMRKLTYILSNIKSEA